jgi:hypothetical protein
LSVLLLFGHCLSFFFLAIVCPYSFWSLSVLLRFLISFLMNDVMTCLHFF